MKFQLKMVLAVAAVVGLASGALWLFRSSEEEAIEQLLLEGASAAERGDVEEVTRLLSADYRNGTEDRAAAEVRIRRALAQQLGQVEVVGAAIQVSGDQAEATCGIRLHALGRELGRFSLRLKLKREPEGWRVVSADENR